MTHELPEVCLLSISQTARMLSLGKTTVYKLIQGGCLQANKIGRRTLVQRDSVLQLVAITSLKGGDS